LRREVPAQDDAVAVPCVQAILEVAVEVLVIVDHRSAQLDEVEVRVTAHEWVGGPQDRVDTAVERPTALELLQREAERPALQLSVDPGDVRVEVQLGAVAAEEPERDTDHADAVERP